MKAPINKRLLACAELVREGAVLADVGTDHAYLAIHLLEMNKIERAVLSDINRGPLEKARENTESAGLLGKVQLRLCNGARELSGLGITDYAICGMGGELISDIIEHAPHLRDGNINLIVQPMSKPDALRRYLFENGFEILKETYVTDEGKHYVCILARFSGKNTSFSEADAHFGKKEIFDAARSRELLLYMKGKLESLGRTARGKRLGGIDTEYEDNLTSELEQRLNSN